MIAFVLGVIASMIGSRVQREAVVGVVRTITGVASASLTCSVIVGQYGRVGDHLVARVEQRQRRVEERLLAAGGDDDLVRRDTRCRSRPCTASQIASRSSAVPAAGVYCVKFASIAACAAALTCSGVGKSGSPAPKSTTSITLAAAAGRPRPPPSASATTAIARHARAADMSSPSPARRARRCRARGMLVAQPCSTSRRHQPAHVAAEANTSLISRELRYVYCSAGIMNTVSTSASGGGSSAPSGTRTRSPRRRAGRARSRWRCGARVVHEQPVEGVDLDVGHVREHLADDRRPAPRSVNSGFFSAFTSTATMIRSNSRAPRG